MIIDSRKIDANLEVLRAEGVLGNVADELAALAHVTPKSVRALAGTVREGDTVGLLVRKIRDQDSMPAHLRGCACDICQESERSKYVGGAFAA